MNTNIMKKIPAYRFLFLLKIFILVVFLFASHIASTYAASSILFQDNFEDGNADKWTPIRGNATLWKVASISGSMRFGARIEPASTIIDTIGPSLETPNYQIDFDYLPITGYVNTNLDFRYRRNFVQDEFRLPYLHLYIAIIV